MVTWSNDRAQINAQTEQWEFNKLQRRSAVDQWTRRTDRQVEKSRVALRPHKILKVVQSQTKGSVRDCTVVGACEMLGTTIREQLPQSRKSESIWRANASRAVNCRKRNYQGSSKWFSDEIGALRKNQSLPRKYVLLPSTPILINRILRSNTSLRHSDDLSDNVKFPVILPKRNHVTRRQSDGCELHHKPPAREVHSHPCSWGGQTTSEQRVPWMCKTF